MKMEIYNLVWLGLGLWYLTPLSTIFHLYHVVVSFIGEGNRSTRRKPSTWHKSLTNYHIMLFRLSGIQTHNFSGNRYWLHR